MIRRPPRSTLDRSSAASDVYKRQALHNRRLVRLVYDQANWNVQPVPRPATKCVITARMHNWVHSHMVLPSNRRVERIAALVERYGRRNTSENPIRDCGKRLVLKALEIGNDIVHVVVFD